MVLVCVSPIGFGWSSYGATPVSVPKEATAVNGARSPNHEAVTRLQVQLAGKGENTRGGGGGDGTVLMMGLVAGGKPWQAQGAEAEVAVGDC